MKRSYIITNLLLLVSTAFLGYELRSQWKEYQATHNMALLIPGRGDNKTNVKVPAESGVVPSYAAIVDNHLFSADRTNIIPPEAPAESVKAVVPKPILLGTMQLDEDEFALMVSDTQRENTNYKQLKVGDALDGYTLVKILDQKVMMKAEGKEVEVRLSVNEPSKMVAREAQAAASTAAGTSGQVTSVGSGPPALSNTAAGNGTVTNQQLPKGTIPVGTIVNGRRKKLVPSPFGMMETWEEVK
jgi:hypothetical protein